MLSGRLVTAVSIIYGFWQISDQISIFYCEASCRKSYKYLMILFSCKDAASTPRERGASELWELLFQVWKEPAADTCLLTPGSLAGPAAAPAREEHWGRQGPPLGLAGAELSPALRLRELLSTRGRRLESWVPLPGAQRRSRHARREGWP